MSQPHSHWHSPPPDRDRARVLELLRRHGHGPTSFQAVERGFSYWFDPQVEGVVAFVEACGARVVAGAPIAALQEIGAVARRFVEEARAAKRPVIFFGLEERELNALRAAGAVRDALKIAEQADFDPARYELGGRARRSLRAQVRRAANKGVEIRRISAEDLAQRPGSIRAEIEQVLDRWLASRRMSVMRFMVDLEPFTFPEERRFYVAERGDQPVGFLAAVPVFGRRGWFLEDVIRVPSAPNGTAEALIDAALEEAREEGDAFVTLGMAPLAGVLRGPGPHWALRGALNLCYDQLGALYHFAGVRRFKERFRPDAWSPQYLAVAQGRVGARAFHTVLAAFAASGLVGFGVDTVRRLLDRLWPRRWAQIVGSLAALLIPWTALLALADGRRWFGTPAVQWAWVAFDVGMVGALSLLSRLIAADHPAAPRLSLFLAGAAGADLLLSTAQAIHLHHALQGWAVAYVAMGLAGPALTALLLAALPWTRAR